MPVPKFSFVPERQLNNETSGSYNVSIRKNGILYFPSPVVRIYDLDGKYFRFFADISKKTIGWSIIEGKASLDDLVDTRKMVTHEKSGAGLFGIGKILKNLGIPKGTTFDKLEVKCYKSPLHSHDVWYITL